MANSPAGKCGIWLAKHGIVEGAAESEGKRRDARRFGGELQATRGRQPKPAGHFTDHGGKVRMAQTLFHGEQHRPACLDENHPCGIKADAGEPRAERRSTLHNPDHPADKTGNDPGNELSRGNTMLGVRPCPGNFMKCTKSQASTRKRVVDLRHAEG